VIEDDTDAQLQYFLNTYGENFAPDQARYRGHGASNLNCGYSLSGTEKVPYVPYTDAVLDLSYGAPHDSSYVCSGSSIKFAPVWYMANSGRDTDGIGNSTIRRVPILLR